MLKMIRKIILWVIMCLPLISLLPAIACSEGADEPPAGNPPQLVASVPADGENDVAEGITGITLRFNMNVTLVPSPKITLNGQQVTNLQPGLNGELKMTVPPLQAATDYTLL